MVAQDSEFFDKLDVFIQDLEKAVEQVVNPNVYTIDGLVNLTCDYKSFNRAEKLLLHRALLRIVFLKDQIESYIEYFYFLQNNKL